MQKMKDRATTPYDVVAAYNVTFRQFLNRANANPESVVNKRSMDIVRLCNEVYSKYRDTVICISCVANMLDFMHTTDYTFNGEIHAMLKLKHSLHWSMNRVRAIQQAAKKQKINEREYPAIRYHVNTVAYRCTYQLEEILPEYIAMTPLAEHLKALEQKDLLLYDDMVEMFDSLPDDMSPEFYNEFVDSYAKKIIDRYPVGEWASKRDNYIKRTLMSKAESNKAREEHKQQAKVKLYNDVTDQLSTLANKFRYNYDHIDDLEKHEKNAYSRLHTRVTEFRIQHKCDPKVILLYSTACRSFEFRKVMFYNSDYPDGVSRSIGNAALFHPTDPLPESVKDRAEKMSCAYVEVIL